MCTAHAERSLDAGDGAIMKKDGGVLLIRIDRPAKRNALTPGLLGRLGEVYSSYESSDALRCAVLFGHGKAFCAGADLKTGARRRTSSWRNKLRSRANPKRNAESSPFGGGSVRWPLRVGWGNSQRYVLTGDLLDAREAD
ncbi:enoyl-CoA hydratase-related protein [Antrihabitans stalactiti]|uniref:Enoyl-CoA hydratase/isomerase family protein n=1 Tax=Antrihabitans stalactiti TaxID=2584121 RepID=A0A848KNY4_9NOCA|nr:enoyl-CoA hydratase-related protein [Antrihabitans stalactiti]NMN98352.1 hypothetical protein [Antrihabitans stalactiti]